MAVYFDDRGSGAMFPGEQAVAITKSDSTVIPRTRGLYVGTTGDLVVRFSADSANVTLKNVAAGMTHPFSVIRVLSTGTTAADIVGIY